MVVDHLHTCYRTTMRLRKDPEELAVVRWYFCPPGAKPLGVPSPFGSSVWETDNREYPTSELGEVDLEFRRCKSNMPPGVRGLATTTPLEWFTTGIPADVDVSTWENPPCVGEQWVGGGGGPVSPQTHTHREVYHLAGGGGPLSPAHKGHVEAEAVGGGGGTDSPEALCACDGPNCSGGGLGGRAKEVYWLEIFPVTGIFYNLGGVWPLTFDPGSGSWKYTLHDPNQSPDDYEIGLVIIRTPYPPHDYFIGISCVYHNGGSIFGYSDTPIGWRGCPPVTVSWNFRLTDDFPLTVRLLCHPEDSPVMLVGAVVWDAGTDGVPPGYLLADGSAVSRTTYSVLFSRYGTTYGAGDGSTTFNLPDLRDQFPVGSGSTYATGDSGGEASHTLLTAEMPAHNHGVTDPGHLHHPDVSALFMRSSNAAFPLSLTAGGTFRQQGSANTSTEVTGITVDNEGGGGSHENRPPYTALRPLIWVGV